MILLAIDTSGKNGSVALARVHQGSPEIELVESVPLAGGTFSAQLVPQIASLLEKHGLTRHDLGGFAVASGPGSFTGLRVGLAAIKGLAEVLQKPIAAVSLLEAIARSRPGHGRVLAVLDAGRGEVYAGDYEFQPEARMVSERLLNRGELLVEAEGKTVITPNAFWAEAVRDVARECLQVDSPDSAAIARIGWERMQRGDTVSPDRLEANYIRRSDAEIFSQPKP